MNRLAHEPSAYLRHAAVQPVDWHTWSGEAFERARREDKPVFVSSGAVWCHWCHVMARESFMDAEIARLLNEQFVCIKLDRDERPDIDRRLQQSVAAMGSGTGWPLTVFMTPDQKVFYGGTYFPPEDLQGRPSFRKVLHAVSRHFRENRADVEAFASSLAEALRPEPLEHRELDRAMLEQAEEALLTQFDPRHGGFGSQPKFPMPGAIEFLLRRYAEGRREAGEAARTTLLSMARGGIHDQLAGGFHRYSVDETWTVPHFEKMADDNAGLLRNYAEAYLLFGDREFLDAARGILSFTRSELSDRSGGFYASQDADVVPGDEGGYFTWTDDELREALPGGDYEILTRHLRRDRSGLHHDPAKKVLAVATGVAEIADSTGRPAGDIEEAVRHAKGRLLGLRARRTPPFIDRMLYTSVNGMMIAAYFRAYLAFGGIDTRDFALRSLDRILNTRFREGRLFRTDAVPALLEDHIHLIDACISAYEATGSGLYLDKARELIDLCRASLFDAAEGGFFDTGQDVLGTRLKRIEDSPHPSPNAAAIMQLIRLSLLTGDDVYRREAELSLRAFADQAGALGVHAGTFFCALHLFFTARTLTIEAPHPSGLAGDARSAAARTFASIRYGAESHYRVIVCANGVCSPPVSDSRSLLELKAGVHV